MEKEQDTETPKSYAVNKDIMFMNTLNDGVLPFCNYRPGVVEHTEESLKKITLPQLSEGSILKSFKAKVSCLFNKGNLVFSKSKKEYYKVVDLKTNDEYKPTFMSLASKDGKSTMELTTDKEFDDFQNYITLNIKIN